MRSVWFVVLLGSCVVAAAAGQPPLQRDKVMVTRDRVPYVVLDDPQFVPAADAAYLGEAERVLGLVYEGESRAYPVRLMIWHHIANDTIGPQRIPVTVVY